MKAPRAAPKQLPHAKRTKSTHKSVGARKRGKGTTKATRSKAARKRGVGRPKVVIDVEALTPLVALGCSHEEIADCLGISRSTLQLRLIEDSELAEAFATMKGERKRNVRAWLTRAASAGNARVLIHLASHELGMHPTRAVELSGRDGAPIEVNQALRPLLEQKLAEFIRSKRENGSELPVAPPIPQIEAEAT